jgi:hypothetical protein
MGSQARGDDSVSVIPFTPAVRSVAADAIKSTKQVRQFLDCFTKPPALLKQIVSMPSIWLRSFPSGPVVQFGLGEAR